MAPVPPIRVNVWRDEQAQDWTVEIIQDPVEGSPQDLPLALIEEMVAQALIDAESDLQQS